jgi:hypothetical protein
VQEPWIAGRAGSRASDPGSPSSLQLPGPALRAHRSASCLTAGGSSCALNSSWAPAAPHVGGLPDLPAQARDWVCGPQIGTRGPGVALEARMPVSPPTNWPLSWGSCPPSFFKVLYGLHGLVRTISAVDARIGTKALGSLLQPPTFARLSLAWQSMHLPQWAWDRSSFYGLIHPAEASVAKHKTLFSPRLARSPRMSSRMVKLFLGCRQKPMIWRLPSVATPRHSYTVCLMTPAASSNTFRDNRFKYR